MKRAVLFALSALAAGAVMAQQAGDVRPLDARAKAPPGVSYRSAFEGYRPFRDQELAPWREVNDEVAKVGGHLGILKSGQNQTADKPAPAGHGHQEGRR